MYKNIFLIITIYFFIGCSTTQPIKETRPNWFTSPPHDHRNFYAVAKGSSIEKAKNKAIQSFKSNFILKLDTKFKHPKHKLKNINPHLFSKILQVNKSILDDIYLNVDIKSKKFKNEYFVLISISRINIFAQLKSFKILSKTKQEYKGLENKIPIKRYITIQKLMKRYPKLASIAQAKKNTLSSYYVHREFDFLNKLANEYFKLKKEISFNVSCDNYSNIYSSLIIKALIHEGLKYNKNSNTLKLKLSSNSLNSIKGAFYKSKISLKCNTYDIYKNKIAFKQHTVKGQSKQSYLDAKEHSAEYIKAKITRFGIFDFIGI